VSVVRRPAVWAVAGVVALALGLWPALGATGAEEPGPKATDPGAGRQMFVTGCSSCHGFDGKGTDRGPTLERSGAAAAYYYLSTGRMPLAADGQPTRKDPVYTDEEIEVLTEYVASLGEGPPVPEVEDGEGDLAHGGVLFRANCAACHSAAGIGGALSYGGYAPSVSQSEPRQIAAAVRVGPGNMPRFGEETFDDEEVASLVRYVRFLQKAPTPGGARLGGAGPIPEGAVGWVIGMGSLIAATTWIGAKRVGRDRS
jgi:ubiquinol-cytochrome c reductase cytochrome c subunit